MNSKISRIASVASALFLFGLDFGAPARQSGTPPPARPAVVVELFTSEGCSSCPPADALLQKLATAQPVSDAEVIAIEEHVDYWNHDGWVDPFSSSEWTQRQEAYVSKLKATTSYTPQMIVDGQSQFIGSNGQLALKAIAQAAHGADVEIALTPDPSGTANAPKFSVKVGALSGTSAGDTADVWEAVTEEGLHSAVSAGENKGHELYHAAVLRTLHKLGTADAAKTPLSFSGDTSVKVKSNWKRENLRLVVFVQEKKSLRIVGATSAKVG